MDFHVLIDDFFVNVCDLEETDKLKNKKILALLNDYEDGSWRYGKFQSFIWDNVAETSLSYDEREALANQSHSLMVRSAQNLRLTDTEDAIGEASELAEIVLYAVMKHHYGALPVVPKIFYKQNTQDNAKGADSVHIVLRGERDFSLWFGEAKFYNSIEDARLDSIVQSVKKSLRTDKLKKENSIITNVSDISRLVTDQKLLSSIRDALSNKQSIDGIKPFLHIPILIIYECQITARSSEFSEEYLSEILDSHKERAKKYFGKQVKGLASVYKYEQIKFHIILFPVPEKSKIKDGFLSNAHHFRSQ